MTPIEYIQKVRLCKDIEFLKAEVIAMQGVMIGQHAALSDISTILGQVKPEPDDVRRALNLAARSAAAFQYPNREFPSDVTKPLLSAPAPATTDEPENDAAVVDDPEDDDVDDPEDDDVDGHDAAVEAGEKKPDEA